MYRHSTLTLNYTNQCSKFWDASVQERRTMGARIWNEARQHLHLPPMTEDAIWNTKYFNRPNPELTRCAGSRLTYKDVWKGGNNFFQFNMVDKCNAHTSASYEPFVYVFSFVRDPLARFVSAYREVSLRAYNKWCTIAHPGSVPIPGVSCTDFEDATRAEYLALKILTHFLNGYNLSYYYEHFILESAFLLTTPPYPSFVGRLECVEDDWARLCSNGVCPSGVSAYDKLDLHMGQHVKSSGDVYGHGLGLEQLMARNPNVRRAIERLVAPDVACLTST